MKKKMWISTLLMAALVLGCGKKDFSKMTFQDGSYVGQYVSEDSEHKDSCEVTLEIKDNEIVSCEAVFKDAKGEVKGEHYGDRKSTRLNSSHANISYAVFCLKKKTNKTQR